MPVLLVVLCLLAGVVGLAMLSNATAGVGIICGACLLAILARIEQASRQHTALVALLSHETAGRIQTPAAPTAGAAPLLPKTGFPRDAV